MNKSVYLIIAVALMIFFSNTLAACSSLPQTPLSTSQSSNIPTSDNPIFTTYAPTSPTPIKLNQAPVIINNASDGAVVHVNLVKYVGTISNLNSHVTVNNSPVVINPDGSYFAFLDLLPGKNNIETKVKTDQNTESHQISITFSPPLAILLDWPQGDHKIDYRKNPITIRGAVSEARATVSVNNQKISVNADCSFTAQVQLKEGINHILSTAVLGENMDTDGLQFDIINGGVTSPPPGFRSDYLSHLTSSDPIIKLNAGQMTVVDFSLSVEKDIGVTPSSYSAVVSRKSSLGLSSTIPLMPLLDVNIIPSSFSIYPGIEYHVPIEVNSNFDTIPGDYYFQVAVNFGKYSSLFTFSVSIQK
jgi:hypothetical protein